MKIIRPEFAIGVILCADGRVGGAVPAQVDTDQIMSLCEWPFILLREG